MEYIWLQSPLRLLAREVQERLLSKGYSCNLIAGQKQEMVAGARITSSTIEMLNICKLYYVAVIDEIQLLSDEFRGSAWTRACELFTVP